MGMTDNENPLGLMPFLNPGFPILGKRRKRSSPNESDPDKEPHTIAGGERQVHMIDKLTTKVKKRLIAGFYCTKPWKIYCSGLAWMARFACKEPFAKCTNRH